MPKELTSFHHLRPRLSSCTGRGTRHALPADCCASAMPGHTAAARATKVRDPGVAWCLLRTRMIRCPDPNTLRPSPTLIMDRHVHTRRLLWVRLAVLKARRLLPVYHNTQTISGADTPSSSFAVWWPRLFGCQARSARSCCCAQLRRFGGWRCALPRLAHQRFQFLLRQLRDLHDHLRRLAPHKSEEYVRGGIE